MDRAGTGALLGPEQAAHLLVLLESHTNRKQASELLIALLPSGQQVEAVVESWLFGSWPQRCRAYLAIRLLLVGETGAAWMLSAVCTPPMRSRLGEMALGWVHPGSPSRAQGLLPLVMAVIAADYRRQEWPSSRQQRREIVRRLSDPLGDQPLFQQTKLL